jgi:hypothetical protein
MRINRFEEIIGVVPVTSIVEGRFGILTENTAPLANFASASTLPGFRVPATADEAEGARFCLTWAVTNFPPPYMIGMPNVGNSFRYGWDKAVQFPASVTYYNTYPGYQDNLTIPSGVPSLAYGVGTYTIPSGEYVDNVALHVAGANVIVVATSESAANAGKPSYQFARDDRVIGQVEEYDSSTGDLTIRVR